MEYTIVYNMSYFAPGKNQKQDYVLFRSTKKSK